MAAISGAWLEALKGEFKKPGTWTLLLSETGSRHSTVTGEYLSGTA